jgi:hypothetical protein
MKARTMLLTLALCSIGVGTCFAQKAFMGIWKLNKARSKFAPGRFTLPIANYHGHEHLNG